MTTSTLAFDPLALPVETPARRARAELVTHLLRRGRLVSDEAFDEIYPTPIRQASPIHWTPMRVAARVVELLALRPGERLLDVGAGVGKFCIVAGGMSEALVCGVERRPELAAIARETAKRLGIDVEILQTDFSPEMATSFDAAYFFNPFAAPLLLPASVAYGGAPVNGDGDEDVTAAEAFFERASPGMRIATYCGFGGTVPAGWTREAREYIEGGWVELWHKAR